MPGPARAGAVIYVKNMESMADFYESVLAMVRIHASSELFVLESADFQLVLHTMPDHITETVIVKSPPELRQTPIKLFFTVASIAQARSTAKTLGGDVFSEQWQGPGFVVCNAYDPERNQFQVRELVS
jgi:predicted enzyme related to lactoylglutathione lyase